jgi:ABC-type uncharacterized transport system involved in gliding motility auxiliary subunit
MKKNQFEHLIYSAVGVIALFLILVAVNYITTPLNQRVDLTQGHVYTLSPGTRTVLSKLESPVRIRYYVTQGEGAMPVQLKTYAQRVEDLLREYQRASGGKVIVEKFNPLPDSEAEESATLDGIDGQLLNTGEKFYFGLAVSQLDQKSTVPVLTPDRERLLEYDITRAVARVSTAEKPVIGVMSALSVFGQGLGPRLMQQGGGLREPWTLISELKTQFNVKEVALTEEKIPDDIKVLLVIHPRDISDVTQWAIDQFVLRGGKLIAFVDPYAYFDQQRDFQNPLGGTQAGQSSLYALFKAWGIDVDMSKVIADLSYPSGQGSQLLPTLLSLSGAALNPDDVVTSQVGTLLIPFGGTFTSKLAEGLKQTVLVKTSTNSMPVDLIIATLNGEPSTRGFKPSGKENPIALRLNGKFKTAFPEGKPKPMAPPAEPGKEDKSAQEKPVPSLKQSSAENAVVVVADVDMLTDNASVDIQDIFGQRVVVPRNGNLNFAQGLVEQFSGDDALLTLRSRASFSRPLTVVKEMEARAQESYLGKIKTLEDSLQEAQKKLEDLQKRRGQAQATILSPEQQAEVENFRKKTTETKKDLKDLRNNLRREVNTLEFWTKVANIALVPLLVALAGLMLALVQRRKAAAR